MYGDIEIYIVDSGRAKPDSRGIVEEIVFLNFRHKKTQTEFLLKKSTRAWDHLKSNNWSAENLKN